MSLLSANDIFEFAVTIEKNGEKYYRKIASHFSEPGIRKLFTYLADEEVKHARLFSDLLTGLGKNELAEIYPEEHINYLREYVSHQIFADEKLSRDVDKIHSAEAAIEFGIWREMDTILFYQELKTHLDQKRSAEIDKIIEEERKHFIKLVELKKEIV